MNKRKAKKILFGKSYNYWCTWVHPNGDSIRIPKSGKHWYLIHRACNRLGLLGKLYLEAIVLDFETFINKYSK